MYSADIISSSIVDAIPRFKRIGLFIFPNSFKRLKPGGKLISISCTERLSKEDQIKYTLESAKTLEQKIKLIQKIGNLFPLVGGLRKDFRARNHRDSGIVGPQAGYPLGCFRHPV